MIQYSGAGQLAWTEEQTVSEERDNQVQDAAENEPSKSPVARNPFADPSERRSKEEGPALIETRKSAAVAGVIVGLVALLLVVAICVAGSMAFG